MALAKAVKDARHTRQLVTWLDGDGDALNLTGATLTGRLQDLETGTARAIDGTLVVVTPVAGVFSWQYGVLDVGTAGHFRAQFTATFADTLADRTLLEDWEVIRTL